MPFTGVQALVNGWVKVNSKYVVFPREGDNVDGMNPNTLDSSHSHSIASMQTIRRNLGGAEHVSQSTTATSASTVTSERDTKSTRKQSKNRKKQPRRLQRTVSHTDLLRELAIEKAIEAREAKEAEEKKALALAAAGAPTDGDMLKDEILSITTESVGSPEKRRDSLSSQRRSSVPPRTHPPDPETESSLRFVSGFFGTDIPLPPPVPIVQSQSRQQAQRKGQKAPGVASQQNAQRVSSSGSSQNVNRPSSVGSHQNGSHQRFRKHHHHHHQQQQQQQHQQQDDPLAHQTLEFTHHRSAPPHHRRSSSNSTSDASSWRFRRQDTVGLYGEDGSTDPSSMYKSRMALPLHPERQKQQQQNPMQQFFKNFPGSKRCMNCEDLEARLVQTQSDIEYLRGVALRTEYVCNRCQDNTSDDNMSSSKNMQELPSVVEASKRLSDMTARHQKQIEAMTLEQSRWQHKMNTKLSDMGSRCDKLSGEASLRKLEGDRLSVELREVKTERDSLATENLQLKQEVGELDSREEELRALRQRVAQLENEGLDHAIEAIKAREEVILDLSGKLRHTMETLENERIQQQQRRQIIFPVNRVVSNSNFYSFEGTNGIAALNEELQRAKEEATSYKLELQREREEAAKREVAWTVRLEHMQKQLNQLTEVQN